ncbi:MAG: hypothetical protein AVDCRST_MAG73-980, partial [uncultured Thermomicrobiales bacterium]
ARLRPRQRLRDPDGPLRSRVEPRSGRTGAGNRSLDRRVLGLARGRHRRRRGGRARRSGGVRPGRRRSRRPGLGLDHRPQRGPRHRLGRGIRGGGGRPCPRYRIPRSPPVRNAVVDADDGRRLPPAVDREPPDPLGQPRHVAGCPRPRQRLRPVAGVRVGQRPGHLCLGSRPRPKPPPPDRGHPDPASGRGHSLFAPPRTAAPGAGSDV